MEIKPKLKSYVRGQVKIKYIGPHTKYSQATITGGEGEVKIRYIGPHTKYSQATITGGGEIKKQIFRSTYKVSQCPWWTLY